MQGIFLPKSAANPGNRPFFRMKKRRKIIVGSTKILIGGIKNLLIDFAGGGLYSENQQGNVHNTYPGDNS